MPAVGRTSPRATSRESPRNRSKRFISEISRSARNLPASKYLAPEGLNVYDILDHTGLILTAEAVKLIEARVHVDARETEA